MVIVAGEKLKLSILTAASDAGGAAGGAAFAFAPLPIPSAIEMIATPKIQNLFFMLVSP
jgi:hypothetical protein